MRISDWSSDVCSSDLIVEREIPFDMASMKRVKLALRNPDFTTARRVARAINAFVGLPAAEVADPTTVVINVPANYKGQTIEMLTDIEQLKIEPAQVDRKSTRLTTRHSCAIRMP